jgi:pyruvate dehydrogenase kinase 2/3/4
MDGQEWPAEMHSYNERFTKMIEAVKRRHDPVVTTVGRFIKKKKKEKKKSDDSSVGQVLWRKGKRAVPPPFRSLISQDGNLYL